ncbi:uncharacterized protein CC84DRAFT_1220504 [Paraphaeosphaeria sporulosa]|uniref:Uncharacterized protein n=1 Tax=Paraphaeosphaeria sporulosa TaxID=1460663 RepID=A0A177C5Z0_9PLEO|nr:uncharacterized protein CC84DRAFT_1220504 [Paraphaeosphaeria sporulosa]OAG02147.1 hypothetical protein CC84DRAFT_1220504 [Paraphaeosphaeria sporulosa]
MVEAPNELLVSAAVVTSTLILGIPVAIGTIVLDNSYVPDIVLGSKSIDAGPSGSKTLSFGLQTSPDEAVLASAYISILASIVLAVSLIILRHTNLLGRTAGWGAIASAAANLLAQIGCIAAWGILLMTDEAKHAQSVDLSYNERLQRYDTRGRMFTREAWACSMQALFREREGAWAGKACVNIKSARMVTIVTTLFGGVLVGVAIWQVRGRGGWGWLRGGAARRERDKNIAMEDYRRS